MSINKIWSKAREIAARPRSLSEYNNMVTVDHMDGSFMKFDGAFVLRYGEYNLIFTEHHGQHVYEKTEARVNQYGPCNHITTEEYESEGRGE
ncbi:MAG: hypothetical protein HN929_05980 [Chloroflexi bacterium]|jgi:hypothetical protein|nr:hypothetical protein [Chloroflexota bacterium]